MRDLAELGDRDAELGHALVQEAVDLDRAVVEVPLRQPHRHAEGDEPLLGTVVEVSLEASALLVADLHEAGPARGDLLQRTRELQPQPHHLDEGAAAGGHLAQQLG